MKANTLAIAATLALAASISGCALDPVAAQRATAFAIGGTAVAPDQIRISNPTSEPGSPGMVFHWHASATTGEYECSAVQGDTVLQQPVCVKQ